MYTYMYVHDFTSNIHTRLVLSFFVELVEEKERGLTLEWS